MEMLKKLKLFFMVVRHVVSKYFSIAASSWFFSTFYVADDNKLYNNDGKSEPNLFLNLQLYVKFEEQFSFHICNFSGKTLPFNQIPGPLGLPILGSQWLYYWKYSLDLLHLANEGNIMWYY